MKIRALVSQTNTEHLTHPEQNFPNYKGDLNALVQGQYAFYKNEDGGPRSITIAIVFEPEK